MSERKILDLAKPILKTWPSESHLEAMILQQENAREWLFDCYVNLLGSWHFHAEENFLSFIPRHNPTPQDISLNAWARCPFLEFYFVSHYFVKMKYENILDYIMYAMEDGYYILLDLNQEGLSTRMRSAFHKAFLYGFDREKETLYVADHYNHGKYGLAELSFEEFVRAYEFTYWDEDYGKLQKAGKELIREKPVICVARPRPFPYEFNVEWFKLQLKDYLDATHRLQCAAVVSDGEDFKRYFGIGSYDLVIDYLDRLLESDGTIKNDWRAFTLISDHKLLYKLRMEFLQEKGIYRAGEEEMQQYDMLYKSAERVLSLFLKYMMVGKKEILQKMKGILAGMKAQEAVLLSELLSKL